MSPTLHHECTRVPVTALASCGALLIAAEGSFLRFYHAKSSKFIASRRIFKVQAVHGISVYAEDLNNVTKIVVWGGRLVRALRISAMTDYHDGEPLLFCLSNVVKAPDWILDLAPRMSSLEDEDVYNQGTCAAVTAHNALLEITIRYKDSTESSPCSLFIDISELTASSRSILYSAHILWESSNCLLVAAGTAFGEIMYWSWARSARGEALSQIHQVFLGHEGSIFDVRISQELQRGCCGALRRVIASCSDDRTIRLWDVSNTNVDVEGQAGDLDMDAQRTRHTGFSVAAAEVQPETLQCLAIGWGHTSRVWRIRFLESSPCDGALGLISAGEDATSRTWKLVANTGKESNLPCTLQQTDCSAYHNGKNMWSITSYHRQSSSVRVACGAADGKITTHPLVGTNPRICDKGTSVAEYTLVDLLHMAKPSDIIADAPNIAKALKKGDSIRSYCFISSKTFLLITNSGKVLIESFRSNTGPCVDSNLTTSTLVGQVEDLSGYSTCTGVPDCNVAFLAGAKGNIQMYSVHDSSLKSIYTVTGKVGSLFASQIQSAEGQKQLGLLITLVGQKYAQLLLFDIYEGSLQPSLRAVSIPISDALTGSTVTSMSLLDAQSGKSTLLGFRRGSIALYTISKDTTEAEASLSRVVEKIHGDETVTAVMFQVLPEASSVGHLYSVGRNGRLAVHLIDTVKNIVTLVHNLTLPIGPNVEGLHAHQGHLLVHGFLNKKWILYDMTIEEEIMGVETGGAHRSWAFQPNPESNVPGGALVWTRTSSLHICDQIGSNHDVLRTGGHGREIKAVAISPNVPKDGTTNHRNLIATGAEDTDIKIFAYDAGELVCRRTLRKHTTGIQHLQWSDNGEYLFSSAGSEEFYVWRIRPLPADLDIGVVCESIYAPESEFSDLRIMSFDVLRRDSTYSIAMVFSDSSVKTYSYTPNITPSWQSLASGTYSTSCLTQSALLSPTLLFTAGTDGHAVFWPLEPASSSPPPSKQKLSWTQPQLLHQNASKTLTTYSDPHGKLIVSGGDDGALAFLVVDHEVLSGTVSSENATGERETYVSPPVIANRAHGSAVTACAVFSLGSRIYVLTSGNDEWVRLWSVEINGTESSDAVTIERLSRVKTSVADVSSMAVVSSDKRAARVLVCGVGMEVLWVEL